MNFFTKGCVKANVSFKIENIIFLMAGFNYKSSNQIIERQQSKVFAAFHKNSSGYRLIYRIFSSLDTIK